MNRLTEKYHQILSIMNNDSVPDAVASANEEGLILGIEGNVDYDMLIEVTSGIAQALNERKNINIFISITDPETFIKLPIEKATRYAKMFEEINVRKRKDGYVVIRGCSMLSWFAHNQSMSMENMKLIADGVKGDVFLHLRNTDTRLHGNHLKPLHILSSLAAGNDNWKNYIYSQCGSFTRRASRDIVPFFIDKINTPDLATKPVLVFNNFKLN